MCYLASWCSTGVGSSVMDPLRCFGIGAPLAGGRMVQKQGDRWDFCDDVLDVEAGGSHVAGKPGRLPWTGMEISMPVHGNQPGLPATWLSPAFYCLIFSDIQSPRSHRVWLKRLCALQNDSHEPIKLKFHLIVFEKLCSIAHENVTIVYYSILSL